MERPSLLFDMDSQKSVSEKIAYLAMPFNQKLNKVMEAYESIDNFTNTKEKRREARLFDHKP